MRVFIQAKNGTPTDQDHFNAYIGFREMVFETVFFESEVKEIIAEFRVFVLYGEIIDVRRYGGRN